MKKAIKERRSSRRAWLKYLDELRLRLHRERMRKKRLLVLWLLLLILMTRVQIRMFHYDFPIRSGPEADMSRKNDLVYAKDDEDRRVLDEQLRIEAEMLARPGPRIPGFPDRYAYKVPSLASLIRDLQNPWSTNDAFDVMLRILPTDLHPWMQACFVEDGHRQFRMCIGHNGQETLSRFRRAARLWEARRNLPPDDDDPDPGGPRPAP